MTTQRIANERRDAALLFSQETKLVTQEEGIPDGWEGSKAGNPQALDLDDSKTTATFLRV